MKLKIFIIGFISVYSLSHRKWRKMNIRLFMSAFSLPNRDICCINWEMPEDVSFVNHRLIFSCIASHLCYMELTNFWHLWRGIPVQDHWTTGISCFFPQKQHHPTCFLCFLFSFDHPGWVFSFWTIVWSIWMMLFCFLLLLSGFGWLKHIRSFSAEKRHFDWSRENI